MLRLTVNEIEHPSDGTLFTPIACDQGVVICRMDPIIGDHAVNVVEVPAAGHHDREPPVVERQTGRYRQRLEPGLAASHHRRCANKVVPEETNQLVAFE